MLHWERGNTRASELEPQIRDKSKSTVTNKVHLSTKSIIRNSFYIFWFEES